MPDLTQINHLLLLVTDRLNKVNRTNATGELTSADVEYGQLLDLEHLLNQMLDNAEQ